MWLAIAALIFAVGVARVSTQVLDDDNLWLAQSALRTSDAHRVETAFQHRISVTEGCMGSAYRWGLRERYAGNYSSYLVANRTIYQLWAAISGASATTAIKAYWTTMALSLALLAPLLLVSAHARDRRIAAAIAVALVGLAAFDILAHTGSVPVWWLPDVPGSWNAIKIVGWSFFVPYEAHSLFGVTPRNFALVLFATALVLRWRDRPLAAALCIAAAAGFHQTYGGIGLILYVIATAAARPEALSRRSVHVVLSAAATVYALRERYFEAGFAFNAIAAAVLALAVFGCLRWVNARAFLDLRKRLLGPLAEETVLLDAAALIVVCAIVTAICLIAAPYSEPATATYFWADLMMRIWSFARFPAFVAAALLVVRMLPRQITAVQVGTMAFALLLAGAALLQTRWGAFGQAGAEVASLSHSNSPTGLHLPEDDPYVYLQLLRVSLRLAPAERVQQQLMSQPLACAPSIDAG